MIRSTLKKIPTMSNAQKINGTLLPVLFGAILSGVGWLSYETIKGRTERAMLMENQKNITVTQTKLLVSVEKLKTKIENMP